jgi:hypothetical protein
MEDNYMTVEQLVPTPETCIKLKDTGYTSKTYFTWWHGINTEDWWLDPIKQLPTEEEILTLPAPTLQELLADLGKTIFGTHDTSETAEEDAKTIITKIVLAANPADEAALFWLSKR